MSDEYADIFKEETYEILDELEKSLLELERSPADSDVVAKIFRAIHTIKGSGAMFGFDMISTFAHELENAFDLVREGELAVSKRLIDLTFSGMDFIKHALENPDIDETVKQEKETIMAEFRKIVAGEHPEAEPLALDLESTETVPVNNEVNNREESKGGEYSPPTETGEEPETPPWEQPGSDNQSSPGIESTKSYENVETTYRIHFSPSADILSKGTDLTKLLLEIHELGICHLAARISNIPALEEIEPNNCYVEWDIILTTSHSKNTIQDIFIFVENEAQIRIDRIDSGDAHEPVDYKKLGNILLERGELSIDAINAIADSKKRFGELLVDSGIVEPDNVESALVEQQHVREIRKKRQETEIASSLRVSSEKVDVLVNLVGELVTLQARLSQLSHTRFDSELISLSEEVERITWELRDSSMEMRMLPIGSTFSRFKRLVRDLSNNLGKEVELTTEGGDTELDKTVIEKLNDPLVHIIRNSIDHGVEPPQVRAAAGKPTTGTVHLNAYHSGSNVVIRITDDGAGLDVGHLKKKAIERGIIPPDKEMTDRESYALIFEPGFSTAKSVSDVSGRGVGMDVVKRNIEALRGYVDIDSQKGAGTAFTLNIPLTLAIIDGLLVKIADEHFVFPLSQVESCIEIEHQRILDANGQYYVNVRGELVPYIYLREQFELHENAPAIVQIVIVDVEKQRVGFVVDHVIGGHQTVIKSLGKAYKNIEGISGATILGDGTIALILDTQKLLANAGLAKNRFMAQAQEN